MARLLVGNSANEELVGAHGKRSANWWAHRLLWFVRDGDVIVAPGPPDEAFLTYVTSLTGVAPDSLRLIVPPPGREGGDRAARGVVAMPVAAPGGHDQVRPR